MEIRFSDEWARANPSFEDTIRRTAQDFSCHAQVKWSAAFAARFVLVDGWNSYKPATEQQHDQIIAALLQLDPAATVRTARAIYKGLSDFERQRQARLTATSV